MPLHGRPWIFREREYVEVVFKRAAGVDGLDPLSGDMAKYLVILVSGWVEQSLYELARERCRREVGGGPLLSFALSHLDRTHNPWSEHIRSTVSRFSEDWATTFDSILTDDRRDALHSVLGLRNVIAHGESRNAATSVGRVKGYFDTCVELMDEVADLLDPMPLPGQSS